MTIEELKYIGLPDNDIRYEVAVTQEVLTDTLNNYASAIVKSKSGAIASFTDGADDVPVKSLSVNIVPKQSGSGDPSPSNVRPISGWDEVGVNVSGKNHVQPTTATSGYGLTINVASDGTVTINGTSTDLMDIDFAAYMPANTPITLSLNNNIANSSMRAFLITPTGANNPSVYLSSVNTTYTLTPTTDIVMVRVRVPSGTTLNNFVMKPQLELGSTATAYEPYEAETKSITLPSTVYGGTLDVTSGVLNVEWGIVDLGSLTWGTYNGKFTSVLPIAPYQSPNVGKATLVCEIYKTGDWGGSASQGEDTIWITGASSSATLYVEDTTYSSVNDFKTAVTGKHMAYKVKTPTTIQLTPTQVTTLLGNNNIWSDAGTVEVEYRADTTLAYNELLSLIANM